MWRFSPRRWPTLAAWILIVLFLCLANWQWQAAQRSAAALAASARSTQAKPTPWVIGQALRPFERVSARGHFITGRDVLLIDLYHHNVMGAQVLTVFVSKKGALWIPVDRGWIPASPLGRTAVHLDQGLPLGRLRITGYASVLPHPGLHLGNGPIPRGWPKPLLFPTHAFLEKIYHHPLTRRALLLDPREPGGFVRHWKPARRIGPGQHFGYAFQWLALALLVFGVWVGLNLHRKSPS
ncbi:MAG: SURF1 family protein [Gammaproteobacteria bacterium]